MCVDRPWCMWAAVKKMGEEEEGAQLFTRHPWEQTFHLPLFPQKYPCTESKCLYITPKYKCLARNLSQKLNSWTLGSCTWIWSSNEFAKLPMTRCSKTDWSWWKMRNAILKMWLVVHHKKMSEMHMLGVLSLLLLLVMTPIESVDGLFHRSTPGNNVWFYTFSFKLFETICYSAAV